MCSDCSNTFLSSKYSQCLFSIMHSGDRSCARKMSAVPKAETDKGEKGGRKSTQALLVWPSVVQFSPKEALLANFDNMTVFTLERTINSGICW